MAFLRLIRFSNLLIIAFVQYVIRYAIVSPILQRNGYELQIKDFEFALLVISTCFIAAAGYIINNYFDRRSDMISKPSEVVIGKNINRRLALVLHFLFNGIAVVMGFYLCYRIGIYKVGIIFIIVPTFLWYYSTYFKNKILIGNILVALFVALIPMMIPLFEIPLLQQNYQQGMVKILYNVSALFKGVFLFSTFSFLMTLIYEILKDIADFHGDKEVNRQSLAIKFGIEKARNILAAIIIITLSLSTVILILHFSNQITIMYYSIFIVPAFTIFIIKLMNAKQSIDYRKIQLFPKIIMVAGILYSFVAYYIYSVN